MKERTNSTVLLVSSYSDRSWRLGRAMHRLTPSIISTPRSSTDTVRPECIVQTTGLSIAKFQIKVSRFRLTESCFGKDSLQFAPVEDRTLGERPIQQRSRHPGSPFLF